jgi:hypothetical protein
MVSPEISRKYIIPALEEEAAFLDHCVYHLDGPGTMPHLDDILAVKDIDVIQWVSGAGQPPMHTWLDVLTRCQKAGKGLQEALLTAQLESSGDSSLGNEIGPEHRLGLLEVAGIGSAPRNPAASAPGGATCALQSSGSHCCRGRAAGSWRAH